MKIGIFTIFVIMIFTSEAQAIENYFEFNYFSLENKFDDLSAESSSYLVRYGIESKEIIGVEVYYGGSTNKENYSSTVINSMNEFMGFNISGIYPMGRKLTIFAKIGLGTIAYSIPNGLEYISSGFTTGVGLNLNITRVSSINIEYLNLPNAEAPPVEIESNAFLIGYRASF